MFNIGATYAHLAAAESTGSVEGLKRACNYLMCAAGVFAAMPSLTHTLQLPLGTDVLESVTSAVGQFMLAQAQECFVLKAILERTVKDTTMARLAFSTAALYESALSQARTLAKATPLFAEHMDVIAVKIILYKAMAHYRKSSEFLINCQYGREIVKLQEADEVLRQGKDLCKKLASTDHVQQINALGVAVSKNLERALKDNTIIYNDPIPARGSWGDCGTAVVVQPIPFPDANLQSAMQEDFFFARLPELQLSRFVEQVYEARTALVNEITARLDNALGALDALFVTLELPGKIQTVLEPEGVPQATYDLSVTVQSRGGYESIEQGKQSLLTQKEQCLVLLELIRKMLNEEEIMDEQARKQHAKTWKRPASSKLNASLKSRFAELQKYYDQGANSDLTAERLLEKHMPSIIMLCYSLPELARTIPSAASTAPPAVTALAQEVSVSLTRRADFVQSKERILTKIFEKVQEYDVVARICQVKEQADPIGMTVDSIKDVIAEELSECAALEMEMAEYSRLLERQMAEFSQHHQPIRMMELAKKRQETLQQLYEAAQVFNVLQKQLKEGLDFYTSLAGHIAKLHKSVMEYDRDRRDEHDRLIRYALPVPAYQFYSLYSALNVPTPTSSASSVPPPPTQMPVTSFPGAWHPSMPVQYASAGFQQPPPPLQPPAQPYHANPAQGYHHPSAGNLPSGYPPAGYPPAGYPPSGYPLMGHSPSGHPPPNAAPYGMPPSPNTYYPAPYPPYPGPQ